ncbi:MAG: hypothetical protein P8J86_11480 [Phycisphaerales bacterium]|nr:hypothetical protein [Phycisphaerales bacterium]
MSENGRRCFIVVSEGWDQGLWFDGPSNGPKWRTPDKAHGDLDGKPISWWGDATKEAVGVPLAQPIVMTGHQPTMHHPGILVKYIALAEQMRAKQAVGVELVIDHHVGPAGVVPIPKVVEGDDVVGDGLIRHYLPLLSLDSTVPLCWQSAQQPKPLDTADCLATEGVANGLQLMHELLGNHLDATDAAGQLAMMTSKLRSPWVKPVQVVRASNLLNTPIGRRLVALMYENPRSCVEAYNKAVQAWPDSKMRLLKVDASQIELPLWKRDQSGQRIAVKIPITGESIPELDALLPRALVITAISRIALADLFIHGQSGAIYDKVMEQWMNQWLGIRPAGAVAISCTLTLPGLSVFRDKSNRGLDRLISLGHRLWHDPQRLDLQDQGPSKHKKNFLDMIQESPWKSTQRQQKYIELHDFLADQRQIYASRLQATERLSRDALASRLETDLPAARDWPFIFYPDEALDSLVARVESALGEEGAVVGRTTRSSLR